MFVGIIKNLVCFKEVVNTGKKPRKCLERLYTPPHTGSCISRGSSLADVEKVHRFSPHSINDNLNQGENNRYR